MSIQRDLQSALSKFRMAEIIEKIAGNRDNLCVEIKDVKFSLSGQRFEIDGTINFNVIHKTPFAYSKTKEIH